MCINKSIIFLFCYHIEVIVYKKHFTSYELNKIATNENYVFKNINDFNSTPIYTYTLPSNKKNCEIEKLFLILYIIILIFII